MEPTKASPIIVRDKLSLDTVAINTDFLYSPFKGGQSVFQGGTPISGRHVHVPVQTTLKVAMGLPHHLTFRKGA